MAPRNRRFSWVPTRSAHAEGHTVSTALARCRRTRRGRRPLAGPATSWTGPGRPCLWPGPSQSGPHGAPDKGTTGMHGGRESDRSRVPRRRPHNVMRPEQTHMAEAVEGRALATGKTGAPPRVRTQCRRARPRARDRLRAAARQDRARRVTARGHPVYAIDRLREAYDGLQREAAPGVDGPDVDHLWSPPRGAPAGPLGAAPAGGISCVPRGAGGYAESRWPPAAHRPPAPGRQERPAGDGGSAPRHLRAGLAGLVLWLPTRPQPAGRTGGGNGGKREAPHQLGARCRHPRVL
jgi:hypothetical protein